MESFPERLAVTYLAGGLFLLLTGLFVKSAALFLIAIGVLISGAVIALSLVLIVEITRSHAG